MDGGAMIPRSPRLRRSGRGQTVIATAAIYLRHETGRVFIVLGSAYPNRHRTETVVTAKSTLPHPGEAPECDGRAT